MLAAGCLACDTGCKGRTLKDRTRWHPIMPFNRHTQKECGRTGRHNRRAGTAYMMSFSFTHCFSISCSLSSCANGTSNLPSTISVLISSLSQHQHSSLLHSFPSDFILFSNELTSLNKTQSQCKAVRHKWRNAELLFRNVWKAEKQNCNLGLLPQRCETQGNSSICPKTQLVHAYNIIKNALSGNLHCRHYCYCPTPIYPCP